MAIVEPCAEQTANDPVPVAFFACPQRGNRDTSVSILVGIKNLSSQPQLLRTHLDVNGGLGVHVIGPDGQPRAPANSWEPASVMKHTLPLQQYWLPRGGVMGRIIDLSCDGPEYTGAPSKCLPLYEFDQPGTYSIRLSSDATYWCPTNECQLNESGETGERVIRFMPIELKIQIPPPGPFPDNDSGPTG